ncbi:MAG: polysaccharide deacetylase family protein [Magnetococcales bacterium]|nr:polysaccharide deacetylase family protein [Magnetococcales bacterium]
MNVSKNDLKEKFDQEYRSGRWEYLSKHIREVPRLGTVAAFTEWAFLDGESILELGCGEGTLFQYLSERCKKSYAGVDLSEVALELARSRGISELYCAQIETFIPPRKFGVILINEVLYYIPDQQQLAVLNRYFPYLAPGGSVILSTYRSKGAESAIWQQIDHRSWEVLGRTIISTASRNFTWDLAVLRPRPAGWFPNLAPTQEYLGKRSLPIPTYKQYHSDGILLTIDDGPSSESTWALLDLLDRHQVHAIFFLIGLNAKAHPDLVAAIVAAGHCVYSHAFSHQKFKRITEQEIIDELTTTEEVLSHYRPTPKPYLLRLPYGNGHNDERVQAIVHGWNSDAVFIDWSNTGREWDVLSTDLPGLQQECHKAAMKLVNNIQPGAILLAHDWNTELFPGEYRGPSSSQVPLNYLSAVLAGVKSAKISVLSIAPGVSSPQLSLLSPEGLLKAATQFEWAGMGDDAQNCRIRAESIDNIIVDQKQKKLLKGSRVDWESDVLASWRRSAGGAKFPKQKIWELLPTGVNWFICRIDAQDIDRMYLFGTYDWEQAFASGSYHLSTIAADPCQENAEEQNNFRHKFRINEIRKMYASGLRFEPIILTACSMEGPFVIIDGNHRAIAMQQLGMLVGQTVFIGLHDKMESDFGWFRETVNRAGIKAGLSM